MPRHFASFLDAYESYAVDGFCPQKFHMWTGLSLIAGALQRKVSVMSGKVHFFPNIYTMLVSYPGVGKSTAIERGVAVLEEMRTEFYPEFKIIPNQVTEPAFIDLMKITDFFSPPGSSVQIPHSSGYFYASEASSSALQNTCGNFVASMTDLYDCSRVFRKKLKGSQFTDEIINPCMNLLVGSTFDYLKTLVNEQSSMGGFASRVLYVVCKDKAYPEIKWGAEAKEDYKTKRKLVEDLNEIRQLVGPFSVTPGFVELYNKWNVEFNAYRKELNSTRIESMIARKGTNLIKLAMLISVSEGAAWKDQTKPELNEYHFDRAAGLLDDVTADIPFILSQAIVADKTSQSGMSQAIMRTLEKNGGTLKSATLKQLVFTHGGQISAFKETVDHMLGSGLLGLEDGDRVKLLVNPDRYL